MSSCAFSTFSAVQLRQPCTKKLARLLCARRQAVASRQQSDDIDLRPESQSRLPPVLQSLLDSRPPPVRLARRTLDMDFAVTLMRTSYNVVDELDVVAMDDFQAQFFELRSREWERFIRDNVCIRQGMLTDPRYFDFISYAQMLTIHSCVRDPGTIFNEMYGTAEGGFKSRVVRRDMARLPGPPEILAAFRAAVGDTLVEKLLARRRDRLRDLAADAKPAQQVVVLAETVDWMYTTFLDLGFCLDLRQEMNTEADNRVWQAVHKVEMVGPCTLWGNQALRQRRSIPSDYDRWCVEALARTVGIEVKCETQFSQSSILRTWLIGRRASKA